MAENEAARQRDYLVIGSVPDNCELPGGGTAPFCIVGRLTNSIRTAVDVNFTKNAVFHENSRGTKVEGNSAGLRGVVSGVIEGFFRPLPVVRSVYTNGWRVIREGDEFEMNANGPEGPANTKGKLVIAKPADSKAAAEPKPAPEFEPLTDEDYDAAAKRLKIDSPMLRALGKKEAGPFGPTIRLPEGMDNPLVPGNPNFPTVRLESRTSNPRFQRCLKGKDIALPKDFKTSAPSGSVAEVSRFITAYGIDAGCALANSSFGLFQIMGFNLGETPEAQLASVQSMFLGGREQLASLEKFITDNSALQKALQANPPDYEKIAAAYNGRNWETTNPTYAKKLKELHEAELEAEKKKGVAVTKR